MAKVRRILVVKGLEHEAECAIRTNGQSPARVFLDELKKGMWTVDPEPTSWPSDEQLHDYDRLLDLIREMCRTGLPPYATSVNYLNGGVWEFKLSNKRLTFFDTDGTGADNPKPKLQSLPQGVDPSDEFWWLPYFDRILRLGTAFPKVGQKTGGTNVSEAVATRKEDLEYDRA